MGTITLQEFDPPSAKLLESFKNWVDTAFGSVEYAFKSIDTDGSGVLSFSELRRATRMQVPSWNGDVKQIFQCLDIDTVAGQRSLSYQEMAFLDSWEPSIADLEEQMLLEYHESPKASHGVSTQLSSTVSSRPSSGLQSGTISGFGGAS